MKKIFISLCLSFSLFVSPIFSNQSAHAEPLSGGAQFVFGGVATVTLGVICPVCLVAVYGAAGAGYVALQVANNSADPKSVDLAKLHELRRALNGVLNEDTFALDKAWVKELQSTFVSSGCDVKKTTEILERSYPGKYNEDTGTHEESLSRVIMQLDYITSNISCAEVDSEGQLISLPTRYCNLNDLGKHIKFISIPAAEIKLVSDGELTGMYAGVRKNFNQHATNFCIYAKAAPQLRKAIKTEMDAIDEIIRNSKSK